MFTAPVVSLIRRLCAAWLESLITPLVVSQSAMSQIPEVGRQRAFV